MALLETYAESLATVPREGLDVYDENIRQAFLESWGKRFGQQEPIGSTELVFIAPPQTSVNNRR